MGDDSADEDSRLLVGSIEQGSLFTDFYRRNRDPLLAWLYRETREPEAAADLMAETFAVALAKRHSFDPRRGEARGWLWGIAKLEVRKWRRHNAVDERARRKLGLPIMAADDDAIAHIESLVDAASIADLIRAALPELPQGERDAVRLRLVDGLEYDEVALELDCQPGAARVRVSRGLRRLRSRLQGPNGSL